MAVLVFHHHTITKFQYIFYLSSCSKSSVTTTCTFQNALQCYSHQADTYLFYSSSIYMIVQPGEGCWREKVNATIGQLQMKCTHSENTHTKSKTWCIFNNHNLRTIDSIFIHNTLSSMVVNLVLFSSYLSKEGKRDEMYVNGIHLCP